MEAAASGLPIVATDIRGCRQVVDDGVTGLLCRVGDADSLRATLSRLIDDPDLRRSMGAAARRKAVADFDERRVVSRVLECYADVASSKGLTIPGLTSPKLSGPVPKFLDEFDAESGDL
jgi:glycosyltransferase involved in cell wall biosynthesis